MGSIYKTEDALDDQAYFWGLASFVLGLNSSGVLDTHTTATYSTTKHLLGRGEASQLADDHSILTDCCK